jgi:uncharacterized protein
MPVNIVSSRGCRSVGHGDAGNSAQGCRIFGGGHERCPIALVFMVSEQFVTPVLVERCFSWLPGWFLRPADFDHIVAMPTRALVVFLGSLLVFAGVVAPVVEELYFRGHLLPAVERYGLWAPVITVALFTLYHVESPWESPGRFLVVLPMTLVVWHKRSVAFGVAAHVALNTLSALALTLAVFAARVS